MYLHSFPRWQLPFFQSVQVGAFPFAGERALDCDLEIDLLFERGLEAFLFPLPLPLLLLLLRERLLDPFLGPTMV